MPSQPDKSTCATDATRLPHTGSLIESAHYLRQASITLRRHSSRLNQMCSKSRHPVTEATAWKH